MKRTKLVSTAAGVLLLGASVAFAQAPAPSKDQAPAQPAPAAQQNAPAEKVAPAAPVRPATSAQAPKAAEPAQAQKSPGSPAAGAADAKTDAKTGAKADAKTDMKVPPAAAKAETKSETKPDAKSSADAAKTAPAAAPASTTGQGAGGAARLSTEQRTKITSVIRAQKVQPVSLNVSISVGTRVPSNVRYYPLPTEVVTYYPEWRGFDYILVGSQILVLDPGTHEIVAILDA